MICVCHAQCLSVQHRFELVHLEEHILPDCPATPLYLVRYAVDGKLTPYFWASKRDRVEMGEQVWFENLKLEAQAAVTEAATAN